MRLLRFIWWAFCGMSLVLAAFLVPAHFRAVDVKIIERAGEETPSLLKSGHSLFNVEKVGPARMVWRAARMLEIEGHEPLGAALTNHAQARPLIAAVGGSDPGFEQFIAGSASLVESRPVMEWLMQRSVRERALEFLRASMRPGVQEILKTHALTNTVHFPPALSASGQALQAAITLAGLLSQSDQFTTALRDAIETAAANANRSGQTEPLETIYLDLLSLGKRLDWAQLKDFVAKIEGPDTLRRLADAARGAEDKLPILYAAVHLSGNPSAVGSLVHRFPNTALNDLGIGLQNNVGGLADLLKRQKRIVSPAWRTGLIGYDPFGAFFYAMVPFVRGSALGGLVFRCVLLFLGAWCGACALRAATSPARADDSDYLRHMTVMQDLSLAFLVSFFVFICSEPYLISETPKVELPVKFKLPVAANATVEKISKTIQPIMTLVTLASLVTFFVLQALIYIWCLTKLAEIRRQPVEARIKLKLLENEEHLFDAGLYFGFVGTVISLILVSIGIVKPSLMAAYSSTSFGIIFVSVLKIFHLRPLRRQLILQSEPGH